MSMTAKVPSDIGDISGVVGQCYLTTSIIATISSITVPSPPLQMAPRDILQKDNIVKMFSEFHIKRDSNYLAPPSTDIEDIYRDFSTDGIELGLHDRCSDCALRPGVARQRYLKYKVTVPEVHFLDSMLVARSLSRKVLM